MNLTKYEVQLDYIKKYYLNIIQIIKHKYHKG